MTTQQLTIIEKQLPKYLSIQVTDNDTLQEASTYLVSAKKELKAVKADMDTLLAPFKEGIDGVKEKYDPRLKALKAVVEHLDAETSQYATTIENARLAKQEKIAGQVTSGYRSLENAVAKIDAIPTVAPLNGMSFRNVPQLVIDDISLIPREYLVPDESKIKSALKLGITIPGAKLINKQTSWNKK